MEFQYQLRFFVFLLSVYRRTTCCRRNFFGVIFLIWKNKCSQKTDTQEMIKNHLFTSLFNFLKLIQKHTTFLGFFGTPKVFSQFFENCRKVPIFVSYVGKRIIFERKRAHLSTILKYCRKSPCFLLSKYKNALTSS